MPEALVLGTQPPISDEDAMGFETFRVELCGGRATCQEADEAVRQLPHARPDNQSVPLAGSTYYLLEDGQHVLEVEVRDAPAKLSCRFTLYHPPSVDAVFLHRVRELMTRFGMEARICDDVPPDQARPFTLQEFPEFAAIATRTIAARRVEWQAAFGDEPLAATATEGARCPIPLPLR